MARLSPKLEVIRALFAKSGNRCAFPGCTATLINERNQFVAQVCHIEAAEEGGERYNPSQTDEARRGFDNLLLLCYPHHVETDDTANFSVERLRKIKAEHETDFGRNIFKIDESLLYKITAEMEEFWMRAELLNREHVESSDQAIEIDLRASFSELAAKARLHVNDVLSLRDLLISNDNQDAVNTQTLRQTLIERGATIDDALAFNGGPNNFEILNLGFTNTATRLNVLLVQMELLHLQEHLKLNSSDQIARRRIEDLKAEFADIAASSGDVD